MRVTLRNMLADETGIALPIAIMMIVLIAVMGAGLLTFSSKNLETTVESNQGQRALNAADAGLEAARRHLATRDAMPTHYDTVDTSDNSSWYDDAAKSNTIPGPWTLTFENNSIELGIRYLKPSSTESQTRLPGWAPEVLPTYPGDSCNDTNGDGMDDDINVAAGDVDACEYPNNRNYFSVGVSGGTGKALRKVQAIYVSRNFDFPVAYYSTRDINVQDSATSVSGLSLFAKRYITGLYTDTLTGQDQAYGNWAVYPDTGLPNPYNTKPRTDTSGSSNSSSAKAAGVAALGDTSSPTCVSAGGGGSITTFSSGIIYDNPSTTRSQKTFSAGSPQRYGYKDLDRDSDYKCAPSLVSSTRPDFRPNTWSASGSPQPTNTLTFPFATNDPSNDADILEALKEKAESQGLYIRRNPGTPYTIEDGDSAPSFPENSDLTETVMYIEFANADGSFTDATGQAVAKGSVLLKAQSSDDDDLLKGTIVVVNGDFETNSSSDDMQGVVIVRDPVDTDAPTDPGDDDTSKVMQYNNGGSLNIEGFVNVEGDINLSGSVDGFLPGSLQNGVPGLFKVSQWSWRECYNADCTE